MQSDGQHEGRWVLRSLLVVDCGEVGVTDLCCELSRQLGDLRRRLSESEAKGKTDREEIRSLRSTLRETEAARDDWELRAKTLAISYPDFFTPSMVELAEWRVLGQRLLRDAVYWDDHGDYRAHWECQHCWARDWSMQDQSQKPSPYPHASDCPAGNAERLLPAPPRG